MVGADWGGTVPGILVMATGWAPPGRCPRAALAPPAENGAQGLGRKNGGPEGSGWRWLELLLQRHGSSGWAPTHISVCAVSPQRNASLSVEEAEGRG